MEVPKRLPPEGGAESAGLLPKLFPPGAGAVTFDLSKGFAPVFGETFGSPKGFPVLAGAETLGLSPKRFPPEVGAF